MKRVILLLLLLLSIGSVYAQDENRYSPSIEVDDAIFDNSVIRFDYEQNQWVPDPEYGAAEDTLAVINAQDGFSGGIEHLISQGYDVDWDQNNAEVSLDLSQENDVRTFNSLVQSFENSRSTQITSETGSTIATVTGQTQQSAQVEFDQNVGGNLGGKEVTVASEDLQKIESSGALRLSADGNSIETDSGSVAILATGSTSTSGSSSQTSQSLFETAPVSPIVVAAGGTSGTAGVAQEPVSLKEKNSKVRFQTDTRDKIGDYKRAYPAVVNDEGKTIVVRDAIVLNGENYHPYKKGDDVVFLKTDQVQYLKQVDNIENVEVEMTNMISIDKDLMKDDESTRDTLAKIGSGEIRIDNQVQHYSVSEIQDIADEGKVKVYTGSREASVYVTEGKETFLAGKRGFTTSVVGAIGAEAEASQTIFYDERYAISGGNIGRYEGTTYSIQKDGEIIEVAKTDNRGIIEEIKTEQELVAEGLSLEEAIAARKPARQEQYVQISGAFDQGAKWAQLSNLFGLDEQFAEWRQSVDKLFHNAFLGGTEYWTEQICYQRSELEETDRSAIFSYNAEGLLTQSAFIAATKQFVSTPEGEKVRYLLTYYIRNPKTPESQGAFGGNRAKFNTKGLDRDEKKIASVIKKGAREIKKYEFSTSKTAKGEPIEYNVFFDNTPLLSQNEIIDVGKEADYTGTDSLFFESDTDYTSICIQFYGELPVDAFFNEKSEICADVRDITNALPTEIPVKEKKKTTTSKQNTLFNEI